MRGCILLRYDLQVQMKVLLIAQFEVIQHLPPLIGTIHVTVSACGISSNIINVMPRFVVLTNIFMVESCDPLSRILGSLGWKLSLLTARECSFSNTCAEQER